MMRPFTLSAISLVLLLTPAVPVTAQGLESPEAFLRRLYAPYLAGNMSLNPTGSAAPAIFDARLTEAIRTDQRNARDEVGALDGDPICDCQDLEPLKSLRIAVKPLGASKATADVSFTNGPRSVSLRYYLTLTSSGWRVSNIASPGLPSLLAHLEKVNRQ